MPQTETTIRRPMSRKAMGFAAGATAGALAGLLLAPKRGADLRRDLRSQADRARAKTVDACNQAARTAGGVVDRGRRAWQAGRDSFRARRQNGRAAS